MSNKITVSKFMRRTHLYVALFLSPWITMYALSTLVMHHREFFTSHTQRVQPEFDLIRETSYDLQVAANESPQELAKRILSEIGINGAFTVQGDAMSGKLTIDRHRPVGSYRVTYDAGAKRLSVERQRFGLAFFLEMLHRRHGFSQHYVANDLWAVIVDVVIVAIVVWAATGIYMWFGLSRTRKLGSVCLLGGSALFSILLFIL
jgi:hypothetical protein